MKVIMVSSCDKSVVVVGQKLSQSFMYTHDNGEIELWLSHWSMTWRRRRKHRRRKRKEEKGRGKKDKNENKNIMKNAVQLFKASILQKKHSSACTHTHMHGYTHMHRHTLTCTDTHTHTHTHTHPTCQAKPKRQHKITNLLDAHLNTKLLTICQHVKSKITCSRQQCQSSNLLKSMNQWPATKMSATCKRHRFEIKQRSVQLNSTYLPPNHNTIMSKMMQTKE